MKYLILLSLLLVGCSPSAEDILADNKILEQKVQASRPAAEKYLNKCFRHWAGHIHTWKKGNERGLEKCTISVVCDVFDKDNCVNSLQCYGWTRFDYVAEIHNRMNLKKEMECPK